MTGKETIRSMLGSGDRRSIGRANEVIELIRGDPRHVRAVIACLWETDTMVAMRAANAIEKISRKDARLLQASKASLIGLLAETDQKHIRWSLALVIPRLQLTRSECLRMIAILKQCLEDRSSIVKTFAMQGLADLAEKADLPRDSLIESIRSVTRNGTPAMKARGRILLKRLELSPTSSRSRSRNTAH